MFTSNSIADLYDLRTSLFNANDVADAIDASLRAAWGGTTSGSTSAYTCSPTPTWTAYASGDAIAVMPHAACIANATLNVSSLGAKGVRWMGNPTVGGEMASGVPALFRYDGTYMHLLNHGGGAASWTPTYGAGGSMTYTSVTTRIAEYYRMGKWVYFNMRADGTTGGTAAPWITFTLPVAPATAEYYQFTASVYDASLNVYTSGGHAIYTGSSVVSVFNYNNSNWGLGSDRRIYVSGFYKA